jgi:LysR family transcriptional activator of nhaA
MATLSQPFRKIPIRPLLEREDVELVLHLTLPELLARLSVHTVDVVLSNSPVQADASSPHAAAVKAPVGQFAGRLRPSGQAFVTRRSCQRCRCSCPADNEIRRV